MILRDTVVPIARYRPPSDRTPCDCRAWLVGVIDGWTVGESRLGAGSVSYPASASASPSKSGDGGDADGNLSADSLPVLLQRAVNRVKELDNGEVQYTTCTAAATITNPGVLLLDVLQSTILLFGLRHGYVCRFKDPRSKAAALRQTWLLPYLDLMQIYEELADDLLEELSERNSVNWIVFSHVLLALSVKPADVGSGVRSSAGHGPREGGHANHQERHPAGVTAVLWFVWLLTRFHGLKAVRWMMPWCRDLPSFLEASSALARASPVKCTMSQHPSLKVGRCHASTLPHRFDASRGSVLSCYMYDRHHPSLGRAAAAVVEPREGGGRRSQDFCRTLPQLASRWPRLCSSYHHATAHSKLTQQLIWDFSNPRQYVGT